MTLAVGRRIQEARKKAGLSQVRLAAELGLGTGGRRTVIRWESGEVTPGLANAVKLEKMLGIELPRAKPKASPSLARVEREVGQLSSAVELAAEDARKMEERLSALESRIAKLERAAPARRRKLG